MEKSKEHLFLLNRKKQLLKDIECLHKTIKSIPSRRREIALTKLRSRLLEIKYIIKILNGDGKND